MTTDPISQLRSINSIFAMARGADPDVRRHIDAAIHFRDDFCKENACIFDVKLSAEKLLQLYTEGKGDVRFLHYDVTDYYGPLWLQADLQRVLEAFSKERRVLVLVRNLKAVIASQHSRAAAKKYYEEALSAAQLTLADWSKPGQAVEMVAVG